MKMHCPKVDFLLGFFLAITVCGANADHISDVAEYMDSAFSEHLPNAIAAAGLELYQMPDFSQQFQLRSADGSMLNGKVRYHSGNMTGLKDGAKKSCDPPYWTSGNVTVSCNMLFLKLNVSYIAEIRFSSADTQLVGLQCLVNDLESNLVVTYSPHAGVPAVKSLLIVEDGIKNIKFTNGQTELNDRIAVHFYHKYLEIFQKIFYGPYRKAVDVGVQSSSLPRI